MTSPLLALESWLESMRVPTAGSMPAGYGGPVVHWWRDCLGYTGPGFDWRYEGIIHGYLALHARSGEPVWLERAQRAGDDLCAAQLPNGTFRVSSFEQNPRPGGTPHEAAADCGLLALASILKAAGNVVWQSYASVARQNIERFYVARLWDKDAQRFRDDPARPSFVPNKSATLVEAFCALTDLTGDDMWLERYARPTLDAILEHQVRSSNDPLDGAIAQNMLGGVVVEKYFPYYVARCIPALLEGATRCGAPRYLEAALAAGHFLFRTREPDGGWPQVLYAGGRANRYPRWIAATGDMLRALELLGPYGLHADLAPTFRRLLVSQLPSGAFKIADGFGSAVSQRHSPTADPRDEAPVVGWNDKVFRYLAGRPD